jgi:hypothetical protein
MTDPLDDNTQWNDMEALVRAAGSYVRPSEELRPRVLEAAQIECRELRVQRRSWQAALLVTLAAMVISLATRSYWQAAAPLSASLLPTPADVRSAEGGTTGWSTVESFTELRRRQAALLSLTR